MMQCTELLITFCACRSKESSGGVEHHDHDFICRLGILNDLVMKIGCTCTCAFTDGGMNGFISAFGKGDLLRQVIVQQSNIDYLPIPWKLAGQMERASICMGVHQSCGWGPVNQKYQSISRASSLLVSKRGIRLPSISE